MQGLGVQGLPKALQCLIFPDTAEFDVKSVQFCVLIGIVDRIELLLAHPVADFPQLRRYLIDRDVIDPTLVVNPSTSKSIAIGLLNGMRVPDRLSDNEFAVGLRRAACCAG